MRFYTNVCQQGNVILQIGYDNGQRFRKPIKYRPYLFLPSNNTTSKYRTIHGHPVERIDFQSLSDARKFLYQYKDVAGFRYYGNENFIYNLINEQFPGEIEFDQSLIRVGYLDIEVASDDGFPTVADASKQVTAITLMRKNTVYVLGCGQFDVDSALQNPKLDSHHDYRYIRCTDEQDLLLKFLDLWEQYDDVITGWYIEMFDIPYLVNRLIRLFGRAVAQRLSPWKRLTERTIEIYGKKTTVYTPDGISILDYIALYKKFVLEPRESYSLDYISYLELGEQKLDYSEHATLHNLYAQDYQKFIEYNIRDVLLVQKLDKKLDLLGLVFTMAYDAKVNFADVLGTVRPWDIIITNYLAEQNIVVPGLKPSDHSRIIGAYVKDPQVGAHQAVVSFDLTSLYPMLIIMYNISPETFLTKIKSVEFQTIDDLIDHGFTHPVVEKFHQAGAVVSANLCAFHQRFAGFLPKLVEQKFNQRDAYKKKMLQAKQQYEQQPTEQLKNAIAKFDNAQKAKKIQINALYGALSNKYFRWCDVNLAQSVTLSGQMTVRWIERQINQFLNQQCDTVNEDYVIAVDTDSIYLRLDKLYQKNSNLPLIDGLDELAKTKVKPFIDQAYDQLGQLVHAKRQMMNMKREAIGDRAVWIAKKRYIMNVFDNEGIRYNQPQLKIMGSEAIRSSTPEVCRQYIKHAYQLIIADDLNGLRQYIDQCYEQFCKLRFEDVAFPRSINGISEYSDQATIYKKKTPPQVKGAILYNRYIDQLGLQSEVPKIGEGEKGKWSYLLMPNPLRDEVITVPSVLPAQLKLDRYIDYKTQFDKAFISPIEAITTKIGWQIRLRPTLPI